MRAPIRTAAVRLGQIAMMCGVVTGCDSIELPDFFPSAATPHEAYAHSLQQAGLHETALAREWLGAADAALRQPVPVTLPIEEAGYLPVERPRAVAYRVNLVRGRRLVLNADLAPAPGALLFIDIFAVPETTADSLRHVIAADSGIRFLEFEPRRTGDYIIRLQPELLRGGRFHLTLRAEPALAFPVHGRANASIQSGFGAPRDGGARDHHGIDIFAPRGTPVLAAAEGVVTRVQETPRGGRVVWVRDERRGNSLYYAHLDRQLVERGAPVKIGDTLGLVGNTGNARSTPPHLHFGIYRRGEGPTDPRPWVALIGARSAPLRADTSLLGVWARTTRVSTLRVAPDREATRVSELTTETLARVLGARAAWYDVRLPDGTAGYLLAADVISAAKPLRRHALEQPTALRAGPQTNAVIIDTLFISAVQVLGRFGEQLYVRADSAAGWIDERNGRVANEDN
jgi:murein DD-endopeptidase MepM/ murein hydrolase activator NlpD